MDLPKPGQVYTDSECKRYLVTGLSVRENGIYVVYTNYDKEFTCLPEAFFSRFTYYGNYEYGKSSLK